MTSTVPVASQNTGEQVESKLDSIASRAAHDSLGDQVIVFSLELNLKENDPAGDMNTTGEFNTP